MMRTLISAAVLAAAAAGAVWLGSGSDLEHLAMLGAAVGGALALAPVPRPLGALGGFGVGFLAAWAGFVLRAAALPDAASGRAIAAAVVVLLCGLVAALTRGRLPLWSMMLGTAVIVGAYENVYANAPTQILTDSPATATTVLLAVAVGYAGAAIAQALLPETDAEAAGGAVAPVVAVRAGHRTSRLPVIGRVRPEREEAA